MAAQFEGKNILVVDDDREMLDALDTILGETGATVRTAADGNAALEVAKDFEPDAVILDAMLPKRSGFLVLEALKRGGKTRGQKPFVIMITGNTGKRHQTWAQSLGVDGYLNKPFRMERLIESLEKLLNNGAGQDDK